MYSKQKEKIENLLNMFKLAKPMNLKNGNGFLVYSDETIDNTSNSKLKYKYENECNEIKNKKEKIFIVITIMKTLKTIIHYMQQ